MSQVSYNLVHAINIRSPEMAPFERKFLPLKVVGTILRRLTAKKALTAYFSDIFLPFGFLKHKKSHFRVPAL